MEVRHVGPFAAHRGVDVHHARVRAALPPPAILIAVPLADGLDRPSLLRYIADSEARQVYLTAGYSDELAATLRRTGVHLAPLGPPRQLPLFSEPPAKV